MVCVSTILYTSANLYNLWACSGYSLSYHLTQVLSLCTGCPSARILSSVMAVTCHCTSEGCGEMGGREVDRRTQKAHTHQDKVRLVEEASTAGRGFQRKFSKYLFSFFIMYVSQ